MNYLVTGGSGFVAGHLIEILIEIKPDARIFGIDIIEPDFYFIDVANLDRVNFIYTDLTNTIDIMKALELSRPDAIIHLAAFSSIAKSWQYPVDCFINNTNIFLNLLEAVRHFNRKIRILAVGSSDQYGIVNQDRIPLDETEPPNPSSPYAAARVAQENLASIYVKGYDLDIVNTRSFNHFGPRQHAEFVLASLAKQVAQIKMEKVATEIKVGNLNIIRDFTDVRDIVKAYIGLVDNGKKGEIYNICSGKGRSIGECLDTLLGCSGIECDVQTDEHLLRPIDNPIIIGCNSKIHKLLGWKPEIPFDVSLNDTMNYFLSRE